MNHNSKDKTKFRQTRIWKEFRFRMIQEADYTCELCGTHYTPARRRMLQLHHRDPEHYDVLDAEKFCVLCSQCHDLTERIAKKIRSKQFAHMRNRKAWAALLGTSLPFFEALILEQTTSEKSDH